MENDRTLVYERHLNKIVHLNQLIIDKFYITLNELLFITSFILNFIIGKLVHNLSPQEEVVNYWNDKRNIFNQLFVKKGWLWTTIVLVLFYGLKRKDHKINYTGVAARYIVSTVWWILFTQWCFGLPIMDKIFLWSGGYCVVDATHPKLDQFIHLFELNEEESRMLSNSISSYACRRLQGTWEGGHDPSGHVFLLVHSSLFLFFEMKPYWQSWSYLVDNCLKHIEDYRSSRDWKQLLNIFLLNPQVIVILLISLWWFMLLMTNIYFHSLFEKFVGLLFGYVGVFVVYYLPRVYFKNMATPSVAI